MPKRPKPLIDPISGIQRHKYIVSLSIETPMKLRKGQVKEIVKDALHIHWLEAKLPDYAVVRVRTVDLD